MSTTTLVLLAVLVILWMLLLRYGSKLSGAGRLLDWLGDRLETSSERRRLARFQEMRRSVSESLTGALREVFQKLGRGTGEVAASRNDIVALLPERAQEFFRRWDILVIAPGERLLDANVLRELTYRESRYLVIGRSEVEPEGWYAVQDNDGAVWFLEVEHSEIMSAELEADSIEHFVLLHQAAAEANGDQP